MTRSFPALLFGFTLALPFATVAQTAAPAAPALPAAPTANAPVAQAPAPGTGVVTTLKAQSNLVILDVVVTDKNHKAIHGLKASDFQVREAGTAQTVKTLEEHTPATVAPPTAPTGPLPPGVFTNLTAVPESGPLNVLLIDRLNTPVDSQAFLHQQLVQFIKTMKPGTRLAVFGLNRQLVYLQGFTSDPKVLLAALEAKKNLPGQSPLLDSSSETAVSDTLTDMGTSADTIANVQQFEAQTQSFQTQLRVRYTMDAMNVLARYLSAFQGRKNLIWFSGSFPLSILPDGDLQDPFAAMADMGDEFRETTGLLTKAQVAVYPIDARGLQSSPVFNASQNNSKYARNPAAFAKANSDALGKIADEHITMRQMASETGGEAFVNTNGLADAVEKAIENGSSYYTITYTPSNVKADGGFRKIQVTTTGGYELAYRRGYYTDGAPKKDRVQLTTSAAAAPAPTPQQMEVRNSMVRGAPTPTQILMKIFVGPLGPPTEATLAEKNVAPPTTKGPYRNYVVNYAALPSDMGFKNVGPGKYEIALQFLTYVYDVNGVLVNSIGNTVQAVVTPANVKAMMETGLQFRQVVSVPAKGDYFLRIGLHDLLVDHVGAIEVPVAAVKNLPVVEIPKPKPAPPTLSDLPK
jgi:VWFA-related protein